ncbi:MAG TPA: hypothetical protein VFO40_28845 [Chthoniobacterales bacterium]|nr:hypothetical protein [Chthoniobacterales bacterium]
MKEPSIRIRRMRHVACLGEKAGKKLTKIMAIIGPLGARTNCTKRSRDSADIGKLQGVSYLR